MLTSTFAIFSGKDLQRTIAFYEALGFSVQGVWDDFGYAALEKDRIELHFAHDPNHEAQTSDHAAYFRTEDVDAISSTYAKLDVWTETFPRFKAAEDKPWGMREIHILDPDGHYLRIGQDPNG